MLIEMKYFNIFITFLLLVCVIIIIIFKTDPELNESKILKDYIEKNDPNFKWTLNATYDVPEVNAKIHVIELTSQYWVPMTGNSSSPLWKHWLQICVPYNWDPTVHETALLLIEGGANQNWAVPTAKQLNSFGKTLCKTSGELTATVQQVPNQYLIFDYDGVERKEDAIVAFTWRKFIDTRDSSWVSLLPQTKSATQAMTAVQQWAEQSSYSIKQFLVTGASKRGWTTWGTAMSGDKRVKAIVPLVIPILDVGANLGSQMQDLGEWSFELYDYIVNGIQNFLYTPFFETLTKIIDPINYINTVKPIPKFIIIAANDEFFAPDSPKFFFSKLKGETKLGIYNTNHNGIKKQSVADGICNFMKLVANDIERPEIKWTIEYSEDQTEGTIYLDVVNGVAVNVTVFSASTISKTKRDFRMYTCEAAECYQNITWVPQTIQLSPSNQYSVTISKPTAGGFTGFYFKVDFTSGSTYSSEMAIVPNILPFPPCSEQECGSGIPAWKNHTNNN